MLNDYRRNKISMVFQNFGLMSHRDVLGNVAYGLEVRGSVLGWKREKKAMEMHGDGGASEGHGERARSASSFPAACSQRVGIARALANDPEVLLMDEPFSALDPLVRQDMQFELLQIQRKLEKTVVFITHDMDEAFKLGDTVAIMRDGQAGPGGTPEEMSAHPADDYVREFIGSADKTKVLCAKHIMVTPCVVRERDTPRHAVREMRTAGVSSAYVVDDHMRFLGVAGLESAIRAIRDGRPSLEGIYETGLETAGEDTVISEILPIAASAIFPIPVVDRDGSLSGIVSKAAVLSSLL